jgi:hypothetical protein
MTGDMGNATFQALNVACILRNIHALWRDREVKGVRASNTIFFLAWGFWNVWFYAHNGFWWSWTAGLMVITANCFWLTLVLAFCPIGTKSILFGVHAFWLHPILIAIAWWRIYGFPWDPRLWVAFFVHDLGYLGKPNMDGKEGESHPELGARIMSVFGREWSDFCLLHSRYYAKAIDRPVSRLCHADKLVIVIEPSWIYIPRAWLSGELAEFIQVSRHRAETITGPGDKLSPEERAGLLSGKPWQWHQAVKSYMRRWIEAHQDGAHDTWTRFRQQQESQ